MQLNLPCGSSCDPVTDGSERFKDGQSDASRLAVIPSRMRRVSRSVFHSGHRRADFIGFGSTADLVDPHLERWDIYVAVRQESHAAQATTHHREHR